MDGAASAPLSVVGRKPLEIPRLVLAVFRERHLVEHAQAVEARVL
jgi:hypothetical protein